MATCSANSVYVVDASCTGHTAGCPTNMPITWWDGNLDQEVITASKIDDLRVKIRTLVSQFVVNPNYSTVVALEPNAIVAGSTKVVATQMNNLDTMLTDIGGHVVPDLPNVFVGGDVTDVEWDDLLSKYDIIRQLCVCNSDCNCNAVCTCNADCLCNYSDERLKVNIEYY